MSNPFDKDKLGKQAVLDFSSIRKKNIESSSQENEVLSISKTSLDKEEMRTKINTVRMHADKEIEKYRDLVGNFRKEVEKLTLFKNVGDAVNGICIDYILEMVIEPTLKGNRPYGMPEDLFRDIRREMYKELLNKYVDK